MTVERFPTTQPAVDELAARRVTSRDTVVAMLGGRVAELERQLEREQARNEGLQLGIDQLSAQLRRLRDHTPRAREDRATGSE